VPVAPGEHAEGVENRGHGQSGRTRGNGRDAAIRRNRTSENDSDEILTLDSHSITGSSSVIIPRNSVVYIDHAGTRDVKYFTCLPGADP